jgi:hypothetical protein
MSLSRLEVSSCCILRFKVQGCFVSWISRDVELLGWDGPHCASSAAIHYVTLRREFKELLCLDIICINMYSFQVLIYTYNFKRQPSAAIGALDCEQQLARDDALS